MLNLCSESRKVTTCILLSNAMTAFSYVHDDDGIQLRAPEQVNK